LQKYILAAFNQNTVGLIVLNVLGSGTNSLVDLVKLFSKLAGNKVVEAFRSPFISNEMLRLRLKFKIFYTEGYVNYEVSFILMRRVRKPTNLE
jgi:hypothetical protein